MDHSRRAHQFQALADPIRLQLLECIAASPDICVCHLSVDPPIADNLLSYHLKVLRDAGLVDSRRDGRWVRYSACRPALETLREALTFAYPAPPTTREGA